MKTFPAIVKSLDKVERLDLPINDCIVRAEGNEVILEGDKYTFEELKYPIGTRVLVRLKYEEKPTEEDWAPQGLKMEFNQAIKDHTDKVVIIVKEA